jgi:hypothetical protein
MTSMEFVFAAPVLRQGDGLRIHYLPLPIEVADALRGEGVRRVVVELNGVPFRRAVMQSSDGGPHLVTGLTILREIGAALGDMVTVVLTADPDPDAIDLPEEFEAALAQDPEAARRFAGFTPGMQRSLAYYVTQAKRTETRVKRSLELAHKLRTHTLHGDSRPPAG